MHYELVCDWKLFPPGHIDWRIVQDSSIWSWSFGSKLFQEFFVDVNSISSDFLFDLVKSWSLIVFNLVLMGLQRKIKGWRTLVRLWVLDEISNCGVTPQMAVKSLLEAEDLGERSSLQSRDFGRVQSALLGLQSWWSSYKVKAGME